MPPPLPSLTAKKPLPLPHTHSHAAAFPSTFPHSPQLCFLCIFCVCVCFVWVFFLTVILVSLELRRDAQGSLRDGERARSWCVMNEGRRRLLGKESGFNMSAWGWGGAAAVELGGGVREGWHVVGRGRWAQTRVMTREDKYAWRLWARRSIMCACKRDVHAAEADE